MSFYIFTFLVFFILKLTGTIDWNWWLVCIPLMVEILLDSIIFIIWIKSYNRIKKDIYN